MKIMVTSAFTSVGTIVAAIFHPKAWKLRQFVISKSKVVSFGKLGSLGVSKLLLLSICVFSGGVYIFAKYKKFKSKQPVFTSLQGVTVINPSPLLPNIKVQNKDVSEIYCLKKTKEGANELILTLSIFKSGCTKPLVVKLRETELVANKIISACRNYITPMVHVKSQN